MIAPSLLGFELTNVCLIKARRRPAQLEMLTTAFRRRSRLGMGEAVVDHDGAPELAKATGVTAYDASYLRLARQLGVELVTLDRKLATAASSCRGVSAGYTKRQAR